MHQNVTISIDRTVLKEFDSILGIATRSAYISNMMKLAVKEAGSKKV